MNNYVSWKKLTDSTPFIVLDVETNGLFKNEKKPRLVSIAWSIRTLEKPFLQKKEFIIFPKDFDPNPEYKKLKHGITKEIATTKGIKIRHVFQSLLESINYYDVKFIICHNLEFDFNVLVLEGNRLGINIERIKSLEKLCTMKLSMPILKLPRSHFSRHSDLYKFPNLRELYQYFHKNENLNWHSASADVQACEACFVGLISILREQENQRQKRQIKIQKQAEFQRQQKERCQKTQMEFAENQKHTSLLQARENFLRKEKDEWAFAGLILGIIFYCIYNKAITFAIIFASGTLGWFIARRLCGIIKDKFSDREFVKLIWFLFGNWMGVVNNEVFTEFLKLNPEANLLGLFTWLAITSLCGHLFSPDLKV